MPVIGLTFNSIEGKRNKSKNVQEIKVNSTPKINNIREINVPSLSKKALSMEFEFLTTYTPDIGDIKITGDMLFMADKNAKILNEWKKKKRLPENVSVEVLNQLFRKCLIKIANIAEDLQLPPPLQLPRVKPADKQEADYVG